jgi:hypothetical protein
MSKKIDLRKEARGRECTVMSNVCNRNSETTVLAHLNMRSIFMCGMGQKPPDWAGAWSCSSCHDLLDGRVSSGEYTAGELTNLHLVAMVRTLKILDDEEKLCPPTK